LRSFKKVLLGAMTAMVAVAVLAVGSASAATPAPPPPPSGTIPSMGYATQDANVPYLAWRGEHIRLVGCDEVSFPEGATATWMLEDPPNDPVFQPAQDFGSEQVSNNCAQAVWVSQKAGVAFIKLIVHVGTANIFEKQFVVGWMELMKPKVVGGGDVNAADFCNKPVFDTLTQESVRLLGPYSNCWHADPQLDPRHRIQVTVKGKLPLENDFSEWGLGAFLTLPDDWGRWAAVMARSTGDKNIVDAMTNWDIHDNSATDEGHVITTPLGTQCPPGTDPVSGEIYTAFDAVDNCTGEGPLGGFSTVFGNLSRTDTTIGPFDPIYPHSTLLSNGKVDAGDAPMPAAQIDVTIHANNAADPTDIGGVGYLYPSYKTEVYSRDGLGSAPNGDLADPVKAHNFYAPFYSQYIPATARPTDATDQYGAAPPSGIDASFDSDGYHGFLAGPLYRNWEIAWPSSRNGDAYSKCLFSQVLPGLHENFRPLPYGYNSVSVYTDESGEANVNYVPGLGMYFDNLIAANKNLNGGCDLENVDPIGKAQIDVTAQYPYQPTTLPGAAADPINFTVHNLFKKTLTVFSKGVDKNNITSNSVAKIVLTHAQDIDGSPLAYELVCWMADSNAAGLRVYAGTLPMPTAADPTATVTLDPYHALFTTFQDPLGLNRLCTFTDRWGNSAIEVFNSGKTKVDVIAEYVNEGILRDTIADFSVAPLGQTPGATSADGPPSSHIPSPTTLQQAVAVGASGPVVASASKPVAKTIKSKQAKLLKKFLHKIRFAQVVTPFHKKAKLVVRVNGKAGMVGLRITIIKGGKSHRYTRFVPANHKMAVKNLSIPSSAAKVTVKLIGL
jgi:hypothetical protein